MVQEDVEATQVCAFADLFVLRPFVLEDFLMAEFFESRFLERLIQGVDLLLVNDAHFRIELSQDGVLGVELGQELGHVVQIQRLLSLLVKFDVGVGVEQQVVEVSLCIPHFYIL